MYESANWGSFVVTLLYKIWDGNAVIIAKHVPYLLIFFLFLFLDFNNAHLHEK